MQYNLTPLLNVEQMIRSLYPVRACATSTASRSNPRCSTTSTASAGSTPTCSPSSGSSSDHGGQPDPRRAPKPFPGAFWWEGPSGKKVLAWNGFHYLFGRSIAKLGDWRFVDQLCRADRRARGRSDLPVRLPLRPVDPSDPRRQRPAGSAHARLRPRLERPGPAPAHRVHHRPRSARCSRTSTAP